MVFLKRGVKKGSSHLEMVLAFSLFIMFTIFLLYQLKSPEEVTLSEIILDNLVISFENYTSTELFSFIVQPNSTNCTNYSLVDYSLSGNSVVKDFVGEKYESRETGWTLIDTGILNSSFSNGILIIESDKVEPLQVFISDEFFPGSATCENVSNLSFGSIVRKNVLSSSKSAAFGSEYAVNYSELKDRLKVPVDVEFSIFSQGLINASKSSPEGVDRKARSVLMDVVYPNGDVKKVEVLFAIW
jgi:hypothetical protein